MLLQAAKSLCYDLHVVDKLCDLCRTFKGLMCEMEWISNTYCLYYSYSCAVEECIRMCLVVNPMERPFIDKVLTKVDMLNMPSNRA